MSQLTLTVEQAGQRADQFLAQTVDTLTRSGAQKLLEQLRGRKIFLFGTAGFGGSEAYFQAILDKTKAIIDDSNTVIGTYMCQGKMPLSVRERYVKTKEQPDHMPNIDAMIENFDKALSHPDADDLAKLANLVSEAIEQ